VGCPVRCAPVRLATWNINSLNARVNRVEEWVSYAAPDVLCLQETKLGDAAFPALTFGEWGYETVHHGQGQWNGVAIASRVGLADVVHGFAPGIEPDTEARIVSAVCGGVRVVSVYVPNGRAVGHEQYQYKLEWLERLRRHVDAIASPDSEVLVAGDFNIAPADADVYDPAAFAGETHVSEPEREQLERLQSWGLTDLFRLVYPDAGRVFSWWDYRRGDFHEGRGMRIDLMLGTVPVASRTRYALIDRHARKGKLPSDHAPLLVDLAT
jgi:exodeoxyribonuclease III